MGTIEHFFHFGDANNVSVSHFFDHSVDLSNFPFWKVTSDSTHEFLDIEDTVIIFIKEFKDSLEFVLTKSVSIVLEGPGEFVSIELTTSVFVHSIESVQELVDTVSLFISQNSSNFIQNSEGWFSLNSKDWVHIWVISTSVKGEGGGHLFVVDLSVSVGVEFVEKSTDLVVSEGASQGFQCLSELLWSNSSVSLNIEVLHNFLKSFSFVVSSMSSLSNLLENLELELSQLVWVDRFNVRVKSPRLKNNLDKVVGLLSWQAAVDFRVERAEVSLGDVSTWAGLSEPLSDVSLYGLCLFFSGNNSWVLTSLEFSNKISTWDAVSSS